MASNPQPVTELHASAKPGLSAYERMVVVCAMVGVLCVMLAGWMAWRPLAPLTLGAALLYVAYLSASGARSEAWSERRRR